MRSEHAYRRRFLKEASVRCFIVRQGIERFVRLLGSEMDGHRRVQVEALPSVARRERSGEFHG